MKTWFVYLVNGKKVGTWAQTETEAYNNMLAEFGNVPMEFVGMNFGNLGAQPDEIIHRGMSPVDTMIATGMVNILASLR